MLVQVYTAQSPREAIALAHAGVNHVGLTPSNIGLPGEISADDAAECVRVLRGHATAVALSVSSNVDQILRMVAAVQPDVLHLCGDPWAVTPEDVAALRPRLGRTKIMQAIAVVGPDAIDAAVAYAPVADYLILDSVTQAVDGVGASGMTHDWSISAKIVAIVDTPVILAGGLGPDNVTDAIRAVHPYGVDSLTRTNRRLPTGGFEKDLDLVRAFAENARKQGSSSSTDADAPVPPQAPGCRA